MTDIINDMTDKEVDFFAGLLYKRVNPSLDFELIVDDAQIDGGKKIAILKSILISAIANNDALGIYLKEEIESIIIKFPHRRGRINATHKGISDFITIDNIALVYLIYHIIPNFKFQLKKSIEDKTINDKTLTKNYSLEIEKPKISLSSILNLLEKDSEKD